jgi:hypothetical protein
MNQQQALGIGGAGSVLYGPFWPELVKAENIAWTADMRSLRPFSGSVVMFHYMHEYEESFSTSIANPESYFARMGSGTPPYGLIVDPSSPSSHG